MKTKFTILCLLFSALVSAQKEFDPGNLSVISKGDQESYIRKHDMRTPATTANYDVKWYRCFWNIDPNIDSISGNVTTLFQPVSADIDTLDFDLNQVLVVDSVIYHNNRVTWSHNSDLLTIHFPSALSHLAVDSVTVYYHGVPPENGFGSFVQGTHSGAPVIWTLSEPYGARDWWPCKNGLTDKADSLDIFIRTSPSYKAASNGLLVSSAMQGPEIVYHWKHRYPIATYLICLGVTNYAVYNHQVPFGGETLNVANYVYPEDSASAVGPTSQVIRMIQVYDSLFGIFPFQREKYGHAQFGWGGGMENQTMTFVTSFDFELLAHELGHQWFGDKVTCGSWSDIWLNEGFATYLSGLCYEFILPSFWERFRQARIKSIISKPDGSVFCPDTTNIARLFDNRLSYAKGAMILHQLRWIIGDSAFFSGLRNYLDDAGLSYGFARTQNLKSHLESSSGQDLTWYFNDWFTGEGFPTYQVNWSQTNDTLAFTVNQTQSDPSVSFFEMSIPLKFKNQTRDTLIRFFNSYSGQTFNVMIPFAVDSVIFDPDYQLITGNHAFTDIGEHTMNNNFEVFPNPGSDQINFRYTGTPPRGHNRICIYDHSGRKMEEFLMNPGEAGMTLDAGKYIPGLYLYLVKEEGNQFGGKFMIAR